MQTLLIFSHICLFFIVATNASAGSSEIFGARKGFPERGLSCPHFLVQDGDDADAQPDHVPTVPFKSECRLQRDVVGLVETLQLESGTKLNCQGHQITPVVPGSNSRSFPELALFLHQVEDVEVQNCGIDGFNHGILVADIKTAPDAPYQKITNNLIKAKFVGIHLVESDNFSIEGNNVTWDTNGGAGILVHYNSDRNKIKNNTVVGDFSSGAQGAVLMPGPSDPNNGGRPQGTNTQNSNPVLTRATNEKAAIMAVQITGEHPQLFNALIRGKLYQFSMNDDILPNPKFSEDNLVEGNTISLPQNDPEERTSGIIVSNSIRTTVMENTIGNPDNHNMLSGIRAGSITGPRTVENRRFPAYCSEDSTRLCLSNFDCNIPGFDSFAKGTCAPRPPQAELFWETEDLRIEKNKIFGPFFSGTTSSSTNLKIIGNYIRGPVRPGGRAAITLDGKYPLESAVVTGNTIENVTIAFNLIKNFQNREPEFFGAAIGLNDIQQYETAVFLRGFCEKSVNTNCSSDSECLLPRPNLPPNNVGPCTLPDFSDFPIELSVDAQDPENVCSTESVSCLGNFWDLEACPGFDSEKVRSFLEIPDVIVMDSHAYLVPIAGLPLNELPTNCGNN